MFDKLRLDRLKDTIFVHSNEQIIKLKCVPGWMDG
jgi:hypothetical protein